MKRVIHNPIIPGFNPDPSICRRGDDYYIACSTFEYFPGIQIHHSKDLKHWRLLTRALDNIKLLDMYGVENVSGVWAPQLTCCDGLFYLIFANVSGVGGPITDSPNYLVTASEITGPWSDPVFLRSGGFDPSIFHDDDGRKYYINMQMGEPGGEKRFDGIWLQEYDPESQRLLGELKKIWEGTSLGITEGPHLYRRDGYYYLFAAEGGSMLKHAVSVARSKQIRGPYETMPDNPLLTSRSHPDWPILAAGHGDIVETPNGEIYMVHLGQRVMGEKERDRQSFPIVPLGRETFIQKLEWKPGDWPVLYGKQAPLPATEVPAPALKEHVFAEVPVRTDFRNGFFPVDFVTLREPLSPDHFQFTENGLKLYGQESLNSRFRQSWLGRRLQHANVRVETKVRFSPPTFRETAGLIVYYDRMNFLYLRLAGCDDGKVKIGVIASDNGVVKRFDAQSFPQETEYYLLRIELQSGFYHFSFSTDGNRWQEMNCTFPISQLGDGVSRIGGFTGTMVGICVQSVSGIRIAADFEYFDYEANR